MTTGCFDANTAAVAVQLVISATATGVYLLDAVVKSSRGWPHARAALVDRRVDDETATGSHVECPPHSTAQARILS